MQSEQAMMQNQQQTLQVLMAKMEADEKRKKVSNPFGCFSRVPEVPLRKPQHRLRLQLRLL